MEVQCKFLEGTWDFDRILYTCKITEASITKPGEEIIFFNGKHLQGRSNSDVTALNFYNTTVHYFPRGLLKIFPNLKSLDINNCGLKEHSREDLIGLENLEILSLRNNELYLLPSDLFFGMFELQIIFFNGNKLSSLSSDLLKPVVGNRLTYVDLSSNTEIDAIYCPGKEKSVGSLQELMDIMDKISKIDGKEEYKNVFAVGLSELWKSKDFSDFTIIGGDGRENGKLKEFAVHKIVLATQSSVLATMLKNNMKEKQTGKMEIDDFSAETVEAMLDFMYTGEVQEMNAMDLFAITAKYEVQLLKQRAEKLILCNIDESNVVEVFGLGHLHKSELMKQVAFKMIKKMFPQTPLSDDLMEQPESLREIIEVHRKHSEAEAKLNETLKKFKKLNE